MKNILTTILFLCFGLTLNAQLIFNEIMYNPPESGTDTHEYVEIYNNSGIVLDVTGYTFSGIVDTLPSMMMQPDSYLVLAKDPLAIETTFGYADARAWTDGALSNGGEELVIRNPSGTIIDVVDYDPDGDWPVAGDGNGPSIELCNFNPDNNNGANWAGSATGTGVVIEGNEAFGTPGAPNTGICGIAPDHVVTVKNFEFDPANIVITVGETVQFTCISGTHNVNGSLADYPNNPEAFFSGAAEPASWTFDHTFETVGDYDYRCDPHFANGMVGTITVLPPPTSDIVITEVMYNTPGFDDFEFLELYNNSDADIDLAGWSFTQGIEHTFSSMMIQPGEYLVVTNNAANMLDLFGVTAIEWTDGTLGNGGEDIVLANAIGLEIDIVDYDDNNGWPAICDGEGPSLVLCDVFADNNNEASWSFSATNAGFSYGDNALEVFASPGAANNACPTAPTIFIDGSVGSVDEGDGSYTFNINLTNITLMDSAAVDVTVMGTSTATEGADFNLSAGTISFSPTSPGGVSVGSLTIDILEDVLEEGNETVVLQLSNPTNGAVIATTDIFTLTIVDNDGLVYTPTSIGDATEIDGDGVPVMDGSLVELEGVVYGVNMRPAGLQFTFIDDNNDGIGLFELDANFGYTVTEADRVIVQGTIGQFNGLLQIDPDTVIFVSANNTLFDPTVITGLSEASESQLVTLNCVSLVDPAQWVAGGSGFNVTVTDGFTETTVRIDADVDLYNEPAPTGIFTVTGIGGQFDSSSPFDSGYQLLPRYMADISGCVAPSLNAINDDVDTDINTAVTIQILDNDIIPGTVTEFGLVTTPSLGSITINTTDTSIVYIPNTDVCGEDTFDYFLCDADGCDTATVFVNIICPSNYPMYDIATVTTTNAEGVADSIDVVCEVRGIVYGVNMRAAGLQFTIIDDTDPDAGISIFVDDMNFGYTVTEGDDVSVQGTIGQFNGLAQIYGENVILHSDNNALWTPEVVTSLSEATESKLVKFEGMTFDDPTQWTGAGSGFNIDVSDGFGSTITVRIDNDVDLYALSIPGFATFNVTGIGGQFDGDSPFDSGYQLLPRYEPDFENFVNTNDPALANQISFFPNPVTDRLTINSDIALEQIEVYNMLGQQILQLNNPDQQSFIATDKFAAGVYVIKFRGAEGYFSAQFIKK